MLRQRYFCEVCGGNHPTGEHRDSVESIDKAESYRESAVAEAASRIWANLSATGLIHRIIEKSAHAVKPDGGELVYDGIEFQPLINGSVGRKAIFVEIGIMPKKEYLSQQVRPKLDRLSDNADERRALAEVIWSGVPEDTKREVARTAIKELTQKYESIILSESRMRGQMSDLAVDTLLKESQDNLDALQKMSEGLENGELVIEVEDILAGLKVLIPPK